MKLNDLTCQFFLSCHLFQEFQIFLNETFLLLVWLQSGGKFYWNKQINHFSKIILVAGGGKVKENRVTTLTQILTWISERGNKREREHVIIQHPKCAMLTKLSW